MTGQTVSHYRVLEKLGQGGMGAVYKGEDLKLGRRVALKLITGPAADDKEFRVRFVREARAAAPLHHPHICTVFELDEEHGLLALELIEGPSLRDKIRERPLKFDEALRIAGEVAEGLKAAHLQGVVHRDIKSGNILLTPDGSAKITDFGLAMLRDSTRVTKTRTSVDSGLYGSEQARGAPADRRTDLWSLGVVLYEMVAGKLPFGGDSEAAVVHSILHEEPEPLTALRAGLPVELDRVVAKCLAKDPDERYQHADDLLVDLRALNRPSATSFTSKLASPVRVRRWPIAVAALAALALGLGRGYLFRAGSGSQAGAPLRKFQIELETDMARADVADSQLGPVISPDGRMVAFTRAGKLSVQDLSQVKPRVIDGTSEASAPFWSPDSKTIGFFSRHALKKVPAQGGQTSTLAERQASGSYLGASWSRLGTILLAISGRGLYEVPETGGDLKPALLPDSAKASLILTPLSSCRLAAVSSLRAPDVQLTVLSLPSLWKHSSPAAGNRN